MACFSAILGVIILLGFINLTAASKDICDFYAKAGQSLTLPFFYEGLTNTHVLKWTHNNTIIFFRQQGRVSVGKTEDISATGSLSLKNLHFSSAGAYEANVLHPNGTSAKKWSARLCMIDKVSKPQLTYVCDFKSSAVNLNCIVAKPQGLVFSWTLDEKTLTSETKQTLSVSLAQLKGQRSFTCSVANKVSQERSDAVQPTCISPSPSPPPSLCFTRKTVVAVVAGGVSLILLLLIIIIILCCCHRRSKTQMRLREIGELRMLSLNKREPDSISPEYETMHPTEDFPPPSPKPSPRACFENVSQPEAQTGNGPLQLSTAAEGQQPSPVPKPRTKNPQTSNI
ncbi:T-cell surface antigen CD2-like [Lates japonicus]